MLFSIGRHVRSRLGGFIPGRSVGSSNGRRRRPRRGATRRLTMEGLEDKRMFAAAPVFTDIVPQAALVVTGGTTTQFGGTVGAVGDATAISNAPLLDGAFVFQLTATTATDILIVDAGFDSPLSENVAGGFYNENDLGTDINPPIATLTARFPELRFDSWVTTPGESFAAGTATLGGEEGANLVTRADTSSDGPQDQFVFATITLLPDAGRRASTTLSGRIQTASPGDPLIEDFTYTMAVADFRVARGAEEGVAVGTVQATDADADALAYSITSHDADQSFSIHPVSGVITTAKALDQLRYEIEVTVEDAEGLTDTLDVVIVASDTANSGWHNSINRFDVNADSIVTPLDALIVINELNGRSVSDPDSGLIDATASAPPFLDVNGDYSVAPIDALLVINQLNEASSTASVPTPSIVLVDGDQAEDDARNPLRPLTLRDLVFSQSID